MSDPVLSNPLGPVARDFIGSGWAFPVQLSPVSRVALVRGIQEIEQAILIILLTQKGQRPRRPEFGCRIHELVFAPNNTATIALARHYVEEALAMWEPRITVTDIIVRPDPAETERLLITIEYEIRATHDRRSLVFPFYRIPEEP